MMYKGFLIQNLCFDSIPLADVFSHSLSSLTTICWRGASDLCPSSVSLSLSFASTTLPFFVLLLWAVTEES